MPVLETPELILPRAMLFDMDGTLTEPMLDFPLIKAEMGIGDRPILEALAAMDDARRSVAEAILHRHEEAAALGSSLNSGCRELQDLIANLNIRSALITRNSLSSVRTVVERHGLTLELMITREDARPKPDPESLRIACKHLGVEAADAWMIGDGQYDVEAGNAAGVPTVWVSHGKAKPFTAEPWRTVRDLQQLRELILAGRSNRRDQDADGPH